MFAQNWLPGFRSVNYSFGRPTMWSDCKSFGRLLLTAVQI